MKRIILSHAFLKSFLVQDNVIKMICSSGINDSDYILGFINKPEKKEVIVLIDGPDIKQVDLDLTKSFDDIPVQRIEYTKIEPDNRICVLIIKHGHGEAISAHYSLNSATDALYGYVTEWWSEASDKEMPEDRWAAMEDYFSRTGETYTIEEVEIDSW